MDFKLTKSSSNAAFDSEDILYTPHKKARRLILRLNAEGRIRVTMPRGTSKREAKEFARKHYGWVLVQRSKNTEKATTGLEAGDEVMFQGQLELLEVVTDAGRPVLEFGDQRIFISDAAMDLRRPLLEHMKRLAKEELPRRCREMAVLMQVGDLKRVTVRDQKTRWGSCSTSGTISLNWRLIQASEAVMEYIIIHELAHTFEMNHSDRFWKIVESYCPDYRVHEKWLKANQTALSWE